MKALTLGSIGVLVSALVAKYVWGVVWNFVAFGVVALAIYAAYRALKHYKVFEGKS
jgi:hypothetical protein